MRSYEGQYEIEIVCINQMGFIGGFTSVGARKTFSIEVIWFIIIFLNNCLCFQLKMVCGMLFHLKRVYSFMSSFRTYYHYLLVLMRIHETIN